MKIFLVVLIELGQVAVFFMLYYGLFWVIAKVISKLKRQTEFKPRKTLLYIIAGIFAFLTYIPTLARYIETLTR